MGQEQSWRLRIQLGIGSCHHTEKSSELGPEAEKQVTKGASRGCEKMERSDTTERLRLEDSEEAGPLLYKQRC